MEAITIEENNLDSDLEFRIEFVPPSSFFFSPLVSAMISVLALSVALVIGMALTKRRARVPTMITVLVLGLLAFSIYWMGLPLQIVLGIVSTSVLLVFPISLVSPSSTTMDKISKKIGGPHVKCPSCGKSNQVQSTVRPLRMPCSDCNSILRLES
jgi:ABC-type dipeptide/oligopeptide/nickel transport system permease component